MNSKQFNKSFFVEAVAKKAQLEIDYPPYEYPPEIYEFERLINECKKLAAIEDLHQCKKQQEKNNGTNN